MELIIAWTNTGHTIQSPTQFEKSTIDFLKGIKTNLGVECPEILKRIKKQFCRDWISTQNSYTTDENRHPEHFLNWILLRMKVKERQGKSEVGIQFFLVLSSRTHSLLITLHLNTKLGTLVSMDLLAILFDQNKELSSIFHASISGKWCNFYANAYLPYNVSIFCIIFLVFQLGSLWV